MQIRALKSKGASNKRLFFLNFNHKQIDGSSSNCNG
jgi:hypothetical protein